MSTPITSIPLPTTPPPKVGYEVRPSTKEKSKKASSDKTHSPFKKSRDVIKGVAYLDNNDPTTVDTTNASTKVWARFQYSADRFAIAYAWNCNILQGRTHYNAAHSKVKGCQAAHAALSPTLYDDMLEIVSHHIYEEGFDHLNEIQQGYLTHRFALTTTDITNLSDATKENRINYLGTIVGRLKPKERMGSFIGTQRDYGRNFTIENPTGSNRVDCHLEHRLRDTEQQLTNRCAQSTLHPTEALHQLRDQYETHLNEMKDNLEEDKKNLASLLSITQMLSDNRSKLPDPMIDKGSYQKAFPGFFDLVQKYSHAYATRFEKKYGAPEFKNLGNYLEKHFSPYVIKDLLKHSSLTKAAEECQCNLIHFKPITSEAQPLFDKAQAEVMIRLDEIEAQLKVVKLAPELLNSLVKLQFGSKDSSGVLKTPDKKQVAEKLIQQVQPLSPTRSDLHHPKEPPAKRVRRALFTDEKNS